MIEQNKISQQSPGHQNFTRKNSQNSQIIPALSGISSQEQRQRVTQRLYSKILGQERPPIRAMLQMIKRYQQKSQKQKQKDVKEISKIKKPKMSDRLAKKEISKLLYLAKIKEQQCFDPQIKKKYKQSSKDEQLDSKMELIQTLEQINYANANSFFPKPVQKSPQNMLRSSNSYMSDFPDQFLNQQSRTISLASSINYQNPEKHIKENMKTIDMNDRSNNRDKSTMQNILERQNKFQGYISAVNHLNHLRKPKHVGKKYLYRTVDTNKNQAEEQKLQKSNKKLSKYFLQKKISSSNIQSRKSLQKNMLSHDQINSCVGKILQNKRQKQILKKEQELLLKSIQRQKFSIDNKKIQNKNEKADYKSKGKLFYNNFNNLTKKIQNQIIGHSQTQKLKKQRKIDPLLFPEIRSYGKFKDLKGKTIQ